MRDASLVPSPLRLLFSNLLSTADFAVKLHIPRSPTSPSPSLLLRPSTITEGIKFHGFLVHSRFTHGFNCQSHIHHEIYIYSSACWMTFPDFIQRPQLQSKVSLKIILYTSSNSTLPSYFSPYFILSTFRSRGLPSSQYADQLQG